ncbi:MAG: hypothetical protein JSV61_13240 [Anaerolineales bacterium]|nr:MAG: hypothetical protein JSV61_13240 [Anaerolineales bacterium]
MRTYHYFTLLPVSYTLSYGLVVIANKFQLFSYARFARLAFYLTPVIFFAIVLLYRRFPPPNGWIGSKSFRRIAILVAGFGLLVSLSLTPFYEGIGRYLITLMVIIFALFVWGNVSVLPAISQVPGHPSYPQVLESVNVNDKSYSWKKYYIEIILLVFYALVGLAGMGVFLYMAFYVRMYGDDWCYHLRAVDQGVFKASIDFYLTWSGRFFSNFLLFAGAGNRWTPMIQMILMISSIFICSYVTQSAQTFGGYQDRPDRILRIMWSLTCALFIPFVIFSITPDPYKSLYWIVSSVVVLPFIVLLPVYLVYARAFLTKDRSEKFFQMSKKRAAGYAVFGLILGFILATIHEVATLPVVVLCGFLFNFALFIKGKRFEVNFSYVTIFLGVALAGSLLGFIVTYFSPGNSIRHTIQGYPQPPDILSLLRLNTHYFLRYLSRISLGAIPFSKSGARELAGFEWFSLISAYILGYLGAKSGSSWRNPLIVLILTVVMTWASFIPGVYAAQVEIPMRAEIIPTTILVLGLFTAGILSPKSFPSYLPIAMLSIVLLLNTFIIRDLFSKQLMLIEPIVSYAGKWDLRNTMLLSSDEAVYLLKPPWDEIEQGKCINDYYNYRRKGVFDK